MGTLKKYLDSNDIGKHCYIEIVRKDRAFLCEGIVSELRSNPLWTLIDENNAKVKAAMSDISSQQGRKCMKIVLA
jgi:hypothetical protein